MKRMLVVLSVLLLSGCASYGSYRYVERSGGGGDYYYDRYDRGHARYTYHGYPFDVTYAYYPYYYSLFWGFRNYYYDPFFSPGFHYGVTWFPRTWFSFSLGYHDWGQYHAYAPWRYSFWDGYYSWSRATWRGRSGYFPTAHTPRFGSARNEAERLASLRAQSRGLPTDKSGDLVLGARGGSAAATQGSARGAMTTPRGPSNSGGRAPAARSGSGAVQRGVAPARTQGTVRGQRAAPPSARAEPSRSRGSWTAQPRYDAVEASHPRMGARRLDAAQVHTLRADAVQRRTAPSAPQPENRFDDRQPRMSSDQHPASGQASQPRALRLETPAPRQAPMSGPRGSASIPTTASAPTAAPARSAPVFAPAPPAAPAPAGRSSGDRMAPRDGGAGRRSEGSSRDRR